ncbi:hypothetical protein AB1Y20_022397 [Prymnesium parvum]|uniref:SAM domain-containing protein n=1 Tax=Prymnesium parvum TaxID=97485 RepID=A0AB34JGT1_PRYPA
MEQLGCERDVAFMTAGMEILSPADLCRLEGLSRRTDLNGLTVRLLKFEESPEGGRWAVLPTSGGSGLKVRPQNLTPLKSSTPPASAALKDITNGGHTLPHKSPRPPSSLSPPEKEQLVTVPFDDDAPKKDSAVSEPFAPSLAKPFRFFLSAVNCMCPMLAEQR